MAKEVTDYTQMIPPPPEDLVEEILRQGAFEGTDLVIYKAAYAFNPLTDRSERMAKCVCTACGELWYEGWAENYGIQTCDKHIKDWTDWECPHCHTKVKLKHSSHISENSRFNNSEWIVVFEKIENKFVIAEYVIIQKFSKNGDKKYEVKQYNAYIFETDKRCAVLQGYRKNMTSVSFLDHWWQKKKCGTISDATYHIYPYKSDFLKGTTVENSRLDKYIKEDEELHPVNYLRLWQARHKVEVLMDIGLDGLVRHELRGFNTNRYYTYSVTQLFSEFNWKEKSPFKITGYNRREMQLIKKFGLSYSDMVKFKELRERGFKLNEENILIAKQWGFSTVTQMLVQGLKISKTFKYLEKQNKSANYYFDYIDMVKKLELDFENDVVKFPKNLTAKHDELVVMIKWQESKKLVKTFVALSQQLSALSYEKDGFYIRVANSESELIAEGKILGHCVGGYGQSHCEGRSIFFVRKAEEPTVPWYTLQVDIKTGCQLQLHGYLNDRNTPIPQEVKDFVRHWLDNIFVPFDIEKMEFIPQKAAATA